MIISATKEAVITASPAERRLVQWFTGKALVDPVEWNDIMLLVGCVENLGYKVLICKYSCSIQNVSTNEVIVRNPNASRTLSKKETVWVALIEFLEWLKK